MDKVQTAGAAIAFILLLPQFLSVLRSVWGWPMFRWWPGRETWTAECEELPDNHSNRGHFLRDPYRAIGGLRGERWCNKREQTVNEWFRVHLGKSRVVSRFRMLAHEKGGYPKRYRLKVMYEDLDNGEWVDYGEHEGPIDYTFPKPIKVCKIQVQIVAPSIDDKGIVYGWSIKDIQVTEPLICGKFLNHVWCKGIVKNSA